jgi:hypothetical protein
MYMLSLRRGAERRLRLRFFNWEDDDDGGWLRRFY